jgi:hypothetical protein
VPGSAASAKRANQRRKRVRAGLLHDGARWFSTVRWLINAGPAAREPHTGLSRMLSYHTPLNPTVKLCIAATLAFSDDALVRRVDDSLLAVIDPGESWTARQHLCARGGQSAIKTTPNPLLIASVLYEK